MYRFVKVRTVQQFENGAKIHARSDESGDLSKNEGGCARAGTLLSAALPLLV